MQIKTNSFKNDMTVSRPLKPLLSETAVDSTMESFAFKGSSIFRRQANPDPVKKKYYLNKCTVVARTNQANPISSTKIRFLSSK